jgi:hypothetical protein
MSMVESIIAKALLKCNLQCSGRGGGARVSVVEEMYFVLGVVRTPGAHAPICNDNGQMLERDELTGLK